MVLILNFVMWGVALYRGKGAFFMGEEAPFKFWTPPLSNGNSKKE